MNSIFLTCVLLTASCAHAKIAPPTQPHFAFDRQVDQDLAFDLQIFMDDNPGDVTLDIDSPGGSVFAGFAIIKALEAHEGKVTCKVDFLAASMAAAILQSCDERIVSKRGMVMIHAPSTTVQGKPGEIAERAKMLKTLSIALFAQYARKTEFDPRELEKLVGDKDIWLTAWQAVELGFADRVE